MVTAKTALQTVETVDLYAIWGNVPYIVKLNNNGGVGDAIELQAK